MRKHDNYFLVIFDHFVGEFHFFQVDGAVTNIGSSLKQNHLIQI